MTLFALSVLATPTFTWAVLVLSDVSQLAATCDSAVSGTVISVKPFWSPDASKILTEVQIRIAEDLKGNAPAPGGILTLTEIGGTADGVTMWVEHAPHFNLGEEVVVFTEVTQDGRIIVVGGDRGKLTLKPAPGIALGENGQPLACAGGGSRGTIAYVEPGRDLMAELRQVFVGMGFSPVRPEPTKQVPADEPAKGSRGDKPSSGKDAEDAVESSAKDPVPLSGECLAGGCSNFTYHYPGGTLSTGSGSWSVVADDTWAGDYAYYHVDSGETYEWSLCSSDGASCSYDSQLTLWNEFGTTQYCYSDDYCTGSDAKIRWTATFTGTVVVLLGEYNCSSNAVNTTLLWRCASCAAEHCYTCPTADYGPFTPGTSWATHSSSAGSGGCRWYQFAVTNGRQYTFTVCEGGGTYTGDPKLWLYNSSCTLVSEDDDTCGLGPCIVWTASYTGSAYLKVGSYDSSATSWTLAYRYRSLPAPSINSVSPQAAPAGVRCGGDCSPAEPTGSLVIINGTGFGTKGCGDHVVFFQYFDGLTNHYVYDDTPCYLVSWSDTQIRCYVPHSASSKDMAVVKGDVWSNRPSFTVTWSYMGIQWPQSAMPIGYYINVYGTPDVPDPGEFNAVQAAFQTWEDVPCCYADFTYLGTTTRVGGTQDAYNVVSWTEGNWPYPSGAIAVTTCWFNTSYCIIECGLELNGVNFLWTTTCGAPSRTDVQNIVTHEVGHWLGLDDQYGDPDAEKTMYGYADTSTAECKKRTLEPEDEAGAQWIYPQDPPAPPSGCSANPNPVCAGQSTQLCGTPPGGCTIEWFTGDCGGTQAGTGNCITVSPSTTTTYYGRSKNTTTGCVSSTCCSVTVAVNPLPASPTGCNANPNPICAGQCTSLSATPGSGGNAVEWFTVSCGGTPVPNPSNVCPTTTTTYYARTKNTSTGCVSSTCCSVTVTVNPLPAPPTGCTATPPQICAGQSSQLCGTPPSGCTIEWFTGSCGGTQAGTGNCITVSPSTTTTYYGRSKNTTTGCVSSTCCSVTVAVNPLPAAPSNCGADPPTVCGAGGSSQLCGTPPGGCTIEWFTGSCGGTQAGTGNCTTVSPSTTTTYYGRSKNTTTGCVSSTCCSVTVTVAASPTILTWEIGADHGASEIYSVIRDGYVEPRACGTRKLRVCFDQEMDTSVTDPGVVAIVGDVHGDQSHLVDQVAWPDNMCMEITLSSALPDRDCYTVTISTEVRSADGCPLEGDRQLSICALAGDVNGDCTVNVSDIIQIRDHRGQPLDEGTAKYDVNCDGVINVSDIIVTRDRRGGTCP